MDSIRGDRTDLADREWCLTIEARSAVIRSPVAPAPEVCEGHARDLQNQDVRVLHNAVCVVWMRRW